MTAATVRHPRFGRLLSELESMAGGARSLVRDIVRSVRPDADDRWLIAAELQIARRSTRHNAPIMAAAAFGVAQSCADWIAFDVRIVWSVAVASLALVIEFVLRVVERRPLDTLDAVRRRAVWQTGCNALFLAAWCSMSVFLWAPGSAVNHMLVALILAASLAGSVVLSSVHSATALTVFAGYGVSLIAPFAFSALPLDHTLAWLCAAYVAMMGLQMFVLHESQNKLLLVERERSELVCSLRLAKQESDRERMRAAAAGRVKSQFLSNMNHELRTPMNAILGFSEVIKRKDFGDAVDKYADYAEIIHRSGLNLLRLIDDMLDLAKIEGGKLGLREDEVSVVRLVEDIFCEYEAKAADLGISLQMQVLPGLPAVHADERALRQIFSNLALNALKYTSAGGSIVLFARVEDDGRLAFGVEDTGIGMTEEDQAQAFDRFGRGRHDVAAADRGSGLGLAIVKGFAEAHDGSVELSSVSGAGTRVTAYLPPERLSSGPRRRIG